MPSTTVSALHRLGHFILHQRHKITSVITTPVLQMEVEAQGEPVISSVVIWFRSRVVPDLKTVNSGLCCLQYHLPTSLGGISPRENIPLRNQLQPLQAWTYRPLRTVHPKNVSSSVSQNLKGAIITEVKAACKLQRWHEVNSFSSCQEKLNKGVIKSYCAWLWLGPSQGWHIIEQVLRAQRSKAKPHHSEVSLIGPANTGC